MYRYNEQDNPTSVTNQEIVQQFNDVVLYKIHPLFKMELDPYDYNNPFIFEREISISFTTPDQSLARDYFLHINQECNLLVITNAYYIVLTIESIRIENEKKRYPLEYTISGRNFDTQTRPHFDTNFIYEAEIFYYFPNL